MNRYSGIVILTGAGISAESGLKTFRGVDGLWEGHKVEDVATPNAFETNPDLVHRFYSLRREQLKTVKPNPAHFALARLEREWEGSCLIVTQNVDDLHERAGSKNLIHMHGELGKGRCNACGRIHAWQEAMFTDSVCHSCGTKGMVRPHIVWFGEMPIGLDQIDSALKACDLFVSIGTSGNVYPAAGFVQQVLENGRETVTNRLATRTVELNIKPTAGTNHFTECRYGPAARIVPEFVDDILSHAV